MAIISDIQEEHNEAQTKSAQSASSSSSARVAATSFSTKFDRGNTSGFLERVFEFLAQESDFLKRPTAERDLVSIFKAVREKERKKMEEERKKRSQEEEKKKKKAEAEAEKDLKAKAEPKAEAKKKDKEETPKVEEKNGKKGTDDIHFSFGIGITM